MNRRNPLPVTGSKAATAPAVLDAILRDFGPAAVVLRSFQDDVGAFTIHELAIHAEGAKDDARVTFAYSNGGMLLDAYVVPIGGGNAFAANAGRIEIDHAKLPMRPAILAFPAITPADFHHFMAPTHRVQYGHLLARTGTAYAVELDGITIGAVAKVRFTLADTNGDKPMTQWLVRFADGRVWSGYGRTRQEAARFLLAREVERREALPLAA